VECFFSAKYLLILIGNVSGGTLFWFFSIIIFSL